MNAPTKSKAPRSARTSGADRRMPRRISGEGERRSTATKAASASTPADEVASVTVAGTSGARTRARTMTSMPPVSVAAPATSTPPGRPATAGRSVRWRTARAHSTAATITGAKKTQRQPTVVSRPPATMPRVNPPAPTPPYTSSARLRTSPAANEVVMIDRLAGVRNPALTPVTNRATINFI
jgi:hypothetical protein